MDIHTSEGSPGTPWFYACGKLRRLGIRELALSVWVEHRSSMKLQEVEGEEGVLQHRLD
jgi:hypothetical protein